MENAMKFLICIFELIIFNMFFKTVLTKRIQRVAVNVFIYGGASIVLCTINTFGDSIINLLASIVVYGCGCLFLFGGSIKQKGFYFVSFYTVFAGVEIISEFFLSSFLVSWEEQTNINRFIISCFEKLLAFIILYFMGKKIRKTDVRMENKLILCSFILPLATFCIYGTIFYSNMQQKMAIESEAFLNIGCILLLFSNAIIFLLHDYVFYLSRKEQKFEITSLKIVMEKKYYDRLEKVNLEQGSYLHDLKYYLRTIGSLAHQKNNVEISSVISSMQIKIEEIESQFFCNHKILNTILCEKKKEAEDSGISFDVYIEPNVKVDFIRDIDIITIIGNLTDNAIEAARKVNGGFVCINIFNTQNGHFLVVKIENKFNGIINKQGENLTSTKENANKHGIGINNVKKSIDQYNGFLQMSAEEDIFISTTVFTIL